MHLRNCRVTQNTIIAKCITDTEDEVQNIGFDKCKWKTALGKCGCRWQNNIEANFETIKMEIEPNWPQRKYRGVFPR